MASRARAWASDERIAHLARVMSLSRTDPSRWPTRDRILYEAAALMAVYGYHGATTRQIADAVGIQQPSIFNHFASKTAIVEALFEYDQVIPSERIVALVDEGGSPACQLYRYVEWQTRWFLEVPFDLRGLRDEQIEEFGLVEAGAALERFRRTLSGIIEAGVKVGQFHGDDHEFLNSVLNALAVEVTRQARVSGPRADTRLVAASAARFVLRAMLRDPATIDTVTAEAESLARLDDLLQ